MDSGNSGSIQSSSGGDEEYDSRAESISAFLNPIGHIVPMSNPPQPPPLPSQPPPHRHNPNSSMLDPLSNYFDPFSRSSPSPLANPNSFLNLDSVWSKTLRSEPNCTEINPVLASPSSVQSFFGSQGQPCGPFTSSSPAVPFLPVAENTNTRASSAAATDQTHVRNPKKRSRASRRAPTTVLTTDTTNFRAMVQEFTGIPAPPFASSPFPRSRFDLFGTPSSMRSNNLLDASQPPYLLRPFAQKFQPPPFVSSSSSTTSSSSMSSSFLSSSMVDGIASTSANNVTSGTSSTSVSNSASINYQLPSELGFLKQQPQGLLNVQNQFLTFQSLLQSAPKYNSAILGSKAQGSLEIPSNDSHLKMGGLDEFGLNHGHVNHTQLTGLPNLVSSDGRTSRNDNNPTSWADGGGSNNGDQSHLRSINGNYDYSPSVNSGKLNYSSNFHGEKGPENVPTRGEGMVESWICSSD